MSLDLFSQRDYEDYFVCFPLSYSASLTSQLKPLNPSRFKEIICCSSFISQLNVKQFLAAVFEFGYICGIPILPCGIPSCRRCAATPGIPPQVLINTMVGDSSSLSRYPHVKRSTPMSHAIPRGFLGLVPLIVRVFMQINKAFH